IAAKFHSLGRNEEARQAIGSIKQRAQVIEVSDWIADTAGRIWAENRSNKMGLVDCIILATAMQEKAVVLTGDAHFKEFKNAKVV
ncbi:TPA: type II toxin-antitoxin system VapC family toxin, partial [Candidatus Micrarchaeota archaeon]|nr:type II toxin-antitoxin system VapC family toxin [Candidatus Micrarchaeota archaeon]